MVQPTLAMAEAFSKDRIAPMLRDTPALRGKVADPKSREAGSTIYHRRFIGGHLTMVGSNSPVVWHRGPCAICCSMRWTDTKNPPAARAIR